MLKRMPLAAMGIVAALSGHVAAQEVIPAYNTYQSVPFVVGEGGLAADLVTYLNDKLKGKYTFKLTQLRRDVLNKTVIHEPNFKGVVMFLNPMFVDDAKKEKFSWTQPLMSDANVVISHTSKPVEYTGVDALKGLKFGGIAGNRYAGFDAIDKDIQREDVAEELTNIKKVAGKKVDVTIMAASTYTFLMGQMGKSGAAGSSLHVSSKKHAEYDRFLFVGKDNTALQKELNGVLANMRGDPAWKAIQAKYGLN